jgi:hypothetical protein
MDFLYEIIHFFASLQPLLKNDFVAQLVEQKTLNLWVVSSILTGVTLKTKRLL